MLFSANSVLPGTSSAAASSLAPCGNPGPAPAAIQHVIVVMLENLSYNQVVGSSNAPYQTSLASQCGVAPTYFAATHTSAANYLAISAGQYPSASPSGCGSVKKCVTSVNSLYNQLSSAGLTWGGFMESMPKPCDPTSSGTNTPSHPLYDIGHNPILFYTDISAAACQANDVGVTDLTAQSGAFWDDLNNQTLPSFSWVTPNAADNNEGPGSKTQNEQAADTWLERFIGTVQQSNSYQSGNTLVLVTYDEGVSSDKVTGEDCTNESLDLPVTGGVSAHQDSCHVPLFVVYPYTPAGDSDSAFFDHYSITKTVEDIFGLPYLAHAGDGQTSSLVGHFGIPGSTSNPSPTVTITQPANGSTASGTVTVAGTAAAQGSASISQVQVSVDNGAPQTATGTTSWSTSIDTTKLTNGTHTITATATDSNNRTATSSITVTVNNAAATSCPAVPPGATEYSGNVSVESSQTGWTGKPNSNSTATRVEPTGGSYDGLWALQMGIKSGSGVGGVNNASPIWVTSTAQGTMYTGSSFVRASVAGEKVSLTLTEETSAGTKVGSTTTSLTLNDTNWHQLSDSYTAQSTGNVLHYSLHASLASASQNFLADCLSLQAP